MSGGGGSSGSNTSTTTSGPPPQFVQAYQDLVNRAQGVAGQPYQPYQGNMVAPLSPDQTGAISNIQNLQGIANPYINAAAQYMSNATAPLKTQDFTDYLSAATGPGVTNAAQTGAAGITGAAQAGQAGVGQAGQAGVAGITGAGATGTADILGAGAAGVGGIYGASNSFNPSQIAQWESPYTQQVVGATQAEFANQNAQQQQGIMGNAVSQGAFGGDRSAVAQGIAAGQQQLAQAPVIAGLENQGYAQAVQAAQAQAAQRLQGATAAGQLGTSAATAAGQLGLGAAQGAGQLGLGAATTQGQMGITGAQAAGAMGLQGATTNAQLQAQAAQQTQAANQAQAWLNSQAGFGTASLGNQALNAGITGANALMGAGTLEQQQAQAGLNVPYYQYQAGQAYPFQTTGWLGNIVEGIGGASGGQSSTSTPVNVGSQVLGAGIAGAGLLGQSGAFGNEGWLTGSGGLFGGPQDISQQITGGIGAMDPSSILQPSDYGSRRGGAIPHRATGGITREPLGDTVPNLDVSIVPGAESAGSMNIPGNPKGTFNLTNPALQDVTRTQTSSGGGGGKDSIFGTLLKGAGTVAAGIYGGPAGAAGANLLGSQVHFDRGGGITAFPSHLARMPGTGRGIVANDAMPYHPPRLAAGGVNVPVLPTNAITGSFTSPGGVNVPLLGSGAAPTGGGGIDAVNSYLTNTAATAHPSPPAPAPAAAAPSPSGPGGPPVKYSPEWWAAGLGPKDITYGTPDWWGAVQAMQTTQPGAWGVTGGGGSEGGGGGGYAGGGIIGRADGGQSDDNPYVYTPQETVFDRFGATMRNWATQHPNAPAAPLRPSNLPMITNRPVGATITAPTSPVPLPSAAQLDPISQGARALAGQTLPTPSGAPMDRHEDLDQPAPSGAPPTMMPLTAENTSPWQGDTPAISGAGDAPQFEAPDTQTPSPQQAQPAGPPPPPAPGGGITTMPTTAQPSSQPSSFPESSKAGNEPYHRRSMDWAGMLVATGAGMLAGNSGNFGTNVGRGLQAGLSYGEQQRVHAEAAELNRIRMEELHETHLANIGNQQVRTGIMQQNADTRRTGMEHIDAYRQFLMRFKAEGQSDLQADRSARLAVMQQNADTSAGRLDLGNRRLDETTQQHAASNALRQQAMTMAQTDRDRALVNHVDASQLSAAMRWITAQQNASKNAAGVVTKNPTIEEALGAVQRAAPQHAAPAQPPPQVGEVRNGYRFNGGEAGDQANWTKQ